MMPQRVPHTYRCIWTYTRRKSNALDRLLALLRRAEISVARALDNLWPHIEAALTGKSRACRWYALWMALLLTLVVVSQFVMWYRRYFLS